jgi:hypothetical protein
LFYIKLALLVGYVGAGGKSTVIDECRDGWVPNGFSDVGVHRLTQGGVSIISEPRRMDNPKIQTLE